jgi:hypothetical protein
MRSTGILQACGQLARTLHGAGQVHGCFYPKHIFLQATGDGYDAQLIDLEKTRPLLFGMRDRVKDLEPLLRRARLERGAGARAAGGLPGSARDSAGRHLAATPDDAAQPQGGPLMRLSELKTPGAPEPAAEITLADAAGRPTCNCSACCGCCRAALWARRSGAGTRCWPSCWWAARPRGIFSVSCTACVCWPNKA